MRSTLASFAALAVLTFAGPLNAQSAPDDVVVNGQHLPRAAAEARARAYVRQVGVAAGLRQASRWIDPVCPKAIGLDAPLADWVEARVRKVAAAAGAKLDKAGCRANFFVLFVADGAQTTRALLDHVPDLVADLPRPRREGLLKGEAPIRWWYESAQRSRDGGSFYFYNNLGGGGSLISASTITAIDHATVVIDAERATGATLSAVADYAALVGLAGLTPQTPPPGDSILALFEGDRRARELSQWDRNFLRALYRVPLAREARQHRGILTQRLTEAASE